MSDAATYNKVERLKFLSNFDEVKVNMQEKRIASELKQSLDIIILPDLLKIIKQYAVPARLWKWNQPNIKDLRAIGIVDAKPGVVTNDPSRWPWMTFEDTKTKLFIVNLNTLCTCSSSFYCCTLHINNAALCFLVSSGALSYKCDFYK